MSCESPMVLCMHRTIATKSITDYSREIIRYPISVSEKMVSAHAHARQESEVLSVCRFQHVQFVCIN